MKVIVPPIKCQGIKTKLVPLIAEMAIPSPDGKWIEPFMGSGVVGFNLATKRATFSDTNPHLIAFYSEVQAERITPSLVKEFLSDEGSTLAAKGDEHYYAIRKRFNEESSSLDFLFLNRACFNGVMRFNRKGGFNVPFCRKPQRFAQAYITKISNQVKAVQERIRANDWSFKVQSYDEAILTAQLGDFIYADPPYIGRHVDYFDSWSEQDERDLFSLLDSTKARFMLSTWEENKYRRNIFVDELWSKFAKVTRSHFYHVGASETNRNTMTEALIVNYLPPERKCVSELPNQVALPL